MTTFAPRPLHSGETPAAGDIFFQRGRQALGVAIRVATGSSINHTGVLLGSAINGVYTVAEANAPGFEIALKEGFTGYVLRVSDDPMARKQFALAAARMTEQGYKYDFLAIARFAAIVLRRARPSSLLGKIILGLPAVLLRVFGQLLLFVLPSESPNRVICSGSVRRLLRETFGNNGWADRLPERDDETSPEDLLAALIGMRRW